MEDRKKDAFLYQALEDIDGFDGILLPQDFYAFIVQRDGSCPYSIHELETWLNEEEEDTPNEDRRVDHSIDFERYR